KTFTCTGTYSYGSAQVTCEKAHGTRTLKTALASSCNCSFAQIAELVGKENMVKYVEQFQVMEPVCFDGITTAAGNYDVSDAASVSFAWSCIGQYTDLINPARYMTFMGTIAGGGVGAEPYLVEKIQVGEEVTYQAETVKTDRIMSQELAATLQEYLHNNVQSVYGEWNFPGLTVCAKSGTSQLGGGQTSNAMFTGFVTDEEYPLAFIVVVENGGYGSATCVPVISRVLAECKAVLDGE
ncbi:MAG: penicillin-binding transpeptidase domain-containing protein, partial [Gemmiger sp.]